MTAGSHGRDFDITPILLKHKRIAIVGGPGSGKTTLAARVYDRQVLHTDDVIDVVPWDDMPDYWLEQTRDLKSFVIEGVQTARYLRRAAKYKEECPVDAVVALLGAVVPITGGQARMLKAVMTVFDEWLDTGESEGIPIYDRNYFQL